MPKIDVQDIDHLGIIAGIIDEIGIVEIIDQELGSHPQEKVSAGQVVKAMILNCMGFLTSPLYLFSQFFMGKATEHLIGAGVKAEYLNESRLGRVMDQLFEYGITLIFVKIANEMSKRFGISAKRSHLDGTSMSVHGKYLTKAGKESLIENGSVKALEAGEERLVKEESAQPVEAIEESLDEEDCAEPVAITITQGYSRDHRPDLKQFTIHLLTSEEEGIPLFMNVGDGNKGDQSAFPEVIKAFQAEWKGDQPELYVMDAAFYSEANLKEFGDRIQWISRVPATIKEAKELTQSLLPEQFSAHDDHQGYRFYVTSSTYADINQQWVVVESQQRMEADLKTVSKRIEKDLKEQDKTLKSLMNKTFACEADALKAVADFEKTLSYHRLEQTKILAQPHYLQRGRPNSDAQPTHYSFHVQATLVQNAVVIDALRQQAGRFILATNSLDSQTWTARDILREYKAQQPTERGFRFLKDPLFFASSIFLKNTKRVMALAMLMTLALMVYTLGQRQLRRALNQANDTLPDQKGKPTSRPTLRWILQCFLSVHLVFLDNIKFQIKLSDRQNLILQFLGASAQKYYFLS
jgi:transposase